MYPDSRDGLRDESQTVGGMSQVSLTLEKIVWSKQVCLRMRCMTACLFMKYYVML